MEIENLRRELKSVLSRNEFLKSLLDNSHIYLLVSVGLCLLSNIRSLYWVNFGGAMALISYIFLIFSFISKKYKALYVGIIGIIVNVSIDLIQTFISMVRYRNFHSTPYLIGSIVELLIFIFIFVKVMDFVKRTGDMAEMKQMIHQGIDRVGQQVNSGMSNMTNGFNSNGASSMGGYSAEYKPISPLGYIGYALLFSIPLVGFILLLVFSFGGTQNVNVKNYARSYFCLIIVVTIVIIFALTMGIGLFSRSYRW